MYNYKGIKELGEHMKKNKIIDWVILILWMGLIFYMSHQPGEVSSEQSGMVMELLTFLGVDLNSYFGELAGLIIRKIAHFTEYFILFIFAYRVLRYYCKKEQIKWYGLLIVFFYACSDELHQGFIPGRGPSFKDVLIDTSGGLGALIVAKIYENIQIKKSNKNN